MRAFISTAGLFSLILSIWLALFIHQLDSPTVGSEFVSKAIAKKERAASQSSSPRILLVGGSNFLFGIDSMLLSQRWSTEVFNLGSYAGLSAAYMVKRAIHIASPGDTLVVALEYDHFRAQHEQLSSTHLDFIASRDSEEFWRSPIRRQLEIIMKMSPSRVLEGILSSRVTAEDSVYRIDKISARGDLNAAFSELSPERKHLRESLEAFHISNSTINATLRKELGALFITAEEKGLCVIAMPPAIHANPLYKTPLYLNFFSAISDFYQQHSVAFVGQASDYTFKTEAMLDTIYHINEEHAAIRSEQLAADLHNPQQYCQ